MRLLLDSHAVIWAADDPARLSPAAFAAIQLTTNELLISAGSIWEIAIKVGLKKLKLSLPYHTWMSQVIVDLGLGVVPITVTYADFQSTLPDHHRDPFDRLMIAQATIEGAIIVSSDQVFDRYLVHRLW